MKIISMHVSYSSTILCVGYGIQVTAKAYWPLVLLQVSYICQQRLLKFECDIYIQVSVNPIWHVHMGRKIPF